MTYPTRSLSARMRNCVSYSMLLTGEVKVGGWWMQCDKASLLAAVEAAIEREAVARGRGRSGPKLTLLVCKRGLSVRSPAGGKEIAAFGAWASPIVVSAARLRSTVASLPGPEVHLEYSDGRLSADWKGMKAREL